MKKAICLLMLVAIYGVTAFGQDAPPKVEIFGDYSYMRFNPSLTGLQSRAFNGGGGGIQFNFGKFFGIKGDFQGYGSTDWTVTYTSPVVTPAGTIPAGTYTSKGNMFTYMFGPVVGVHAKKATFFAEVLFGGSNTNGYANLTNSINAGGGAVAAAGTQHPFTMAFGGGIDLNVGKHVAIRLAELDYVLTRYTNPITDTNNQNNFRYLGGIVFRFGGEKPAPPPAAKMKPCPGGTSVAEGQECPKRDINLAVQARPGAVCPGAVSTVSPSGALPEGAVTQWTVNGQPASQAGTFEFASAGRTAGSYRVALRVTAPGYNDATAEATVTVSAYAPPTGSLSASPSEIWVGDKATLSANFSAGQCGGPLGPVTYTAAEGSASGTQFDSTGVRFDPANTSEQRKTITITAKASDGKGTGTATATVVVKQKGAVTARRYPDIVFPKGSARINNCGKRVLLEELKGSLDSEPNGNVVFVGHISPKEKGANLDAKRALNAAAVISAGAEICLGFSAANILITAAGTADNGVDFQPRFCEASVTEKAGNIVAQAEDEAKNRRVEVWFVPPGAAQPASAVGSKDALGLQVKTLGCPK